MSAPMSNPAELPPDPMTQTKNRLAEVAEQQAAGYLERQARKQIKAYVPKFLWPLIPGEKGSVGENLQKEASKRFWAMVWSAVFSLIFFVLFAGAFAMVGVIVLYAILTA